MPKVQSQALQMTEEAIKDACRTAGGIQRDTRVVGVTLEQLDLQLHAEWAPTHIVLSTILRSGPLQPLAKNATRQLTDTARSYSLQSNGF